MKNTMKRNIILSALLIIMLCVSLISGATYALFTSTSEVNIAVTSGKVEVVATVENLQTYSMNQLTTENGLFTTGGTAILENGTLTLNRIVPGDKVTFNIRVKNNSNVTIWFKTIINKLEDNGLFDGLNITLDGIQYNGNLIEENYVQLQPSSADKLIQVVVELPKEAGNEYQEKTCKIVYKVEAIQGNANIESPELTTVSVKKNALPEGTYQLLIKRSFDQVSRNTLYQINDTNMDNEVTFTNENTTMDLSLFYGNVYLKNGNNYYLMKIQESTSSPSPSVTIKEVEFINNLNEFKAFRDSVNNGTTYVDSYVYLTTDLNLNNEEWTPIGTSSNPFRGNLDGNNHIINNLKITTGENVGLFGHVTLGPANYTPGIENLTLNNVNIAANNSGAFVGNANTTTLNAGNGGALLLENLNLVGNVTIEGENVGGIVGANIGDFSSLHINVNIIGWTDFQIMANNITIRANEGSYVKGTGTIGGAFAATPHGHIYNIESNINVIASGEEVVAGGIVGCAGWELLNVTCTGNVTVTGVEETATGKYNIGKIVGAEANNPWWNYYKASNRWGSEFVNFNANNTISITLLNGTVLTNNGITTSDKYGTLNQIDYTQSMVGGAMWNWEWTN